MEIGTGLFLGFIVLQRVGELVLARRNTARLLARGAHEVGREHYPAMVLLHAAWLLCLLTFGHGRSLSVGWLGIFVVLQGLRIWILVSLGERWTTRIIVIEGPLIKRGPFRYVTHPNYMLVIAEIVAAPMVLGLGWIAALFTLLNAMMLSWRIRVENRALAPLREVATVSGR